MQASGTNAQNAQGGRQDGTASTPQPSIPPPSTLPKPLQSEAASSEGLQPLLQRISRQPPVASPLRSSVHAQHASFGSNESTPTGSPTSVNNVLQPGMSDLLPRPVVGMQRARSHLDQSSGESSAGSGSGSSTPTSHALPLHHTTHQRSSMTEQRRHSDTDHLAVHMSSITPPPRWAGPIQATVPNQQQPQSDDVRKSEAGLSGTSYGTSSGTSGIGTSGYASSVDADYYSLPPSRLVSRTPTPVLSGGHGAATAPVSGHHLSPDNVTSTTEDSDEEDSDYAGAPGWSGPASFFGFGSKASNFKRFGGKDYQAAETRKGREWADDPDTLVMESQKGFRGKDRSKAFESASAPARIARPASLRGSRSQRRKKQTSSRVPWPFRVVSSLLFKTFRTFFGPIHPLTIMIALVLIAGFVTSVTMLIIYILNPDKEPLPWRTYCQQQMPFPHAYAEALAPVNVLVGVLTVDSKYERRNIIRQTYARHTVPTDSHGNLMSNVQVKFVLGKVRKSHARKVALEMEAFNDIVVLDMEETQSARKTLGFLKWAAENATVPFLRPVGPNWNNLTTVVPNPAMPGGLSGWDSSKSKSVAGQDEQRYQLGWKKVDYVVKADDDSYLVLDELERHLRVAPRKMTYWGYLIKNWFMGGEAYGLSFDLVDWMAHSLEVSRTAKGKEDTRTPQWIALHPNRSSINWVSEHCWIYDHPKGGSPYSHGFLFPDYVERIKLEARHGLSEQEIAYRGGERASQSYSTVTKWHQKYAPPRRDLTVEEEVEALIEGGGRWAGTWVRNADGSEGETWIPYEDIVYGSDDDRLAPSATNGKGSSVLADDIGWEPSSGLPIYGRVNSSLDSTGAATERRDLLADLTSFPKHLLGSQEKVHKARQSQVREGGQPMHHLLPRPSHKDGNGEYAALRSMRYLNRPHGGTVVVHYLKKTEMWLETALALSGKPNLWTNGAGGSGKEWRMGGSPLVREDGYVLQGRSQPRPVDVRVAPADDPYTEKSTGAGAGTSAGHITSSGQGRQDSTHKIDTSSSSNSQGKR